MASSDRRARERERLREEILDAVRSVAIEDGWAGLTVRKVADRIEYSPASLYLHFDSKEAMLEEVRRQGWAQIGQFASDLSVDLTAEERLVRLSLYPLELAEREPELYQLVFGMVLLPAPDDRSPEVLDAMRIQAEVTDGLLTKMGIVLDDPITEIQTLQAAIHGLVVLSLTGAVPGGLDRARILAERVVRNTLQAWRVGPG